MDFQKLIRTMNEINSGDTAQSECGEMMPAPDMQAPAPEQMADPKPSMSVNLNAQGLSNIEGMMKLLRIVTPEMMPQEPAQMPVVSNPPALNAEAYSNEPEETEYDIDDVVFAGNDLHRAKGTYPKVAGGDNPMQAVGEGHSDKVKNLMRNKFQQQDPTLTTDQIDYYLDRWDRYSKSFPIDKRDIMRLPFDQVAQLIDTAEIKQAMKGKSVAEYAGSDNPMQAVGESENFRIQDEVDYYSEDFRDFLRELSNLPVDEHSWVRIAEFAEEASQGISNTWYNRKPGEKAPETAKQAREMYTMIKRDVVDLLDNAAEQLVDYDGFPNHELDDLVDRYEEMVTYYLGGEEAMQQVGESHPLSKYSWNDSDTEKEIRRNNLSDNPRNNWRDGKWVRQDNERELYPDELDDEDMFAKGKRVSLDDAELELAEDELDDPTSVTKYIKAVRDAIESGIVDPGVIEKDFFNQMAAFDVDIDRIADQWERMTGTETITRKPTNDKEIDKTLASFNRSSDDSSDPLSIDLDSLSGGTLGADKPKTKKDKEDKDSHFGAERKFYDWLAQKGIERIDFLDYKREVQNRMYNEYLSQKNKPTEESLYDSIKSELASRLSTMRESLKK